MAQRKKRKLSIKQKLLVIMLLVVLLQGVICCGAVAFNGGFVRLQESENNTFISTTQGRRGIIEDLITHEWSNIDAFQKEIQQTVQQTLEEKELPIEALETDKALNQELLASVSGEVLDMLRYNATTEAYVILQGYGSDADVDSHSGLCIRNLNQTTGVTNDGLLMEIGSKSIAQQLGIPLDSGWTTKLDKSKLQGSFDFYEKPLEEARKNPDYQPGDLGYWSDFYQWHENDMRVLSYSLPLIQNDVVYGVVGITISRDYLGTMLPFNELDQKNTGSYVLAVRNNKKQYTPIYTAGTASKDIGQSNRLEYDGDTLESQVYALKLPGESLSTVQTINIYSNKSPFQDTQWALIGVLPKSTLYRASDQLRDSIILAALVSTILGVLAAIWGGYNFTKPILKMVNLLKKADGNEILKIPESDVKEVDELVAAVTTLNNKVRDNASKVLKIIEMVDLPLGIIEYQKNGTKVFCTSKVVRMLNLHMEEFGNGFYERGTFEANWGKAGLTEFLNQNLEREYQVETTRPVRWLSIRSLCEAERTLITVLDITKDVDTRHKIEYERDYDLLTGLLSRRAFEQRVGEVLKKSEKSSGTGAMVMWDLDNLKCVNDNYGHDYGDAYIQKAAGIFGTLTEHGGIVGRISGDEFLAYLPGYLAKEEVMDQLIRVRNMLGATKLKTKDQTLSVRASAGVAWFPEDGDSYEVLKKHADQAMYETKKNDKGGIREFGTTS